MLNCLSTWQFRLNLVVFSCLFFKMSLKHRGELYETRLTLATVVCCVRVHRVIERLPCTCQQCPVALDFRLQGRGCAKVSSCIQSVDGRCRFEGFCCWLGRGLNPDERMQDGRLTSFKITIVNRCYNSECHIWMLGTSYLYCV